MLFIIFEFFFWLGILSWCFLTVSDSLNWPLQLFSVSLTFLDYSNTFSFSFSLWIFNLNRLFKTFYLIWFSTSFRFRLCYPLFWCVALTLFAVTVAYVFLFHTYVTMSAECLFHPVLEIIQWSWNILFIYTLRLWSHLSYFQCPKQW